MALFDLNRAQDTPVTTFKLAEIVPKNWHRFPARVGSMTPAYVPTVTFTGGAVGDDVSVSTAASTDAYSPKTQAEKAALPGTSPPNAIAGEPDFALAEDITRPRGWVESDDPYSAKPGAGANPTITSLAPNTAVAVTGPDLIVVITGTNFTPWSTVTSGNFPIPVRYISATKLEIVQKPRSSVAGTVSVVVTDHGVASAGSNFVFT